MNRATEHLMHVLAGMKPRTAMVLGSGLGGLVSMLENAERVPYRDLEGFPHSGVSGHAGELAAGFIGAVPVILLSGRAHYYERGDAAAMRWPLEVMKAIGIEQLILTNSAGSLRPEMDAGSVMMIADHINFAGANPLIGESSDARFVGLTNAYDAAIMDCFRKTAKARGVTLNEGVYMWFSGPSFETPAEIRMARTMGADAVGMSTVPEVILGRFLGLRCAAFSVITNLAAGMTGAELSHGETKENAPKGGRMLGELIAATLKDI
ncbi:MAG: purine-nucleoside phosphorylase [Nitratireductor sp.]|jgi:purine-nucleoside phosphorylase|nr:purine-nucleoside phosphorylase [Nitratireductor sp.]